MEIVSEPDMRSVEEASLYARQIQKVVDDGRELRCHPEDGGGKESPHSIVAVPVPEVGRQAAQESAEDDDGQKWQCDVFSILVHW